MSLEKVKSYFKNFNMDKRIIVLDSSSATVELAAKALGIEEARIAKTMSFLIDENPILVVAAGDAKIDNKKYKEKFHTKAKMIPFDFVEKYIGHTPGGVCPFGVGENIEIYLDNSLKRFQTVFPAAGSSNSAIELNMSELEKYSNSKEWIDVCKINL